MMWQGTEPERGVAASVILPTRNGLPHVVDQLEALESQPADFVWELVVVDNGSSDGTAAFVRQWSAKSRCVVRVVEVPEPGSAVARNAGAACAHGVVLLFVDDDDVVGPGWLQAMFDCLRTQELVGSSFEYHRLNDDAVGAVRGSFQTTAPGLVLGTPVVSSGGLGCSSKLWERLGGMDPQFAPAGEDIDFSLRATLDLGVVPEVCEAARYSVRVRHGLRSSYSQGYRFAIASVRLYRIHGARLGAKPDPLLRVLRRWIGLGLRVPSWRRTSGRAAWAWQFGTRVGRLSGSARERVWYP